MLGKVRFTLKFAKILLLSLIISSLVFANCVYAVVDVIPNAENQQKIEKKKKKDSKKNKTITLQETTEKFEIKENSTLSLDDCIKIAIENSPTIKKYQNLVVIANSLTGQSKSSYFPSLNLGTGYSGDYNNTDGNSDFNNSYKINASISQLLFSFGKVSSRIKKAKLNKIAADFDLNYEIIKTVFNVKTNYFAVLAAIANIKVQEANILVNERQYQQTKAYFEEGLKSKIDLVNSEVYLSNAKINLVSAKNTYDQAVIALNNSMYVDYAPKYNIEKIQSFQIDNKYATVELQNTKQGTEKFKAPALANGAIYQTSVQKNELLKNNYHILKFPYTFEQSIALAKENRPDLKSYIAARDALKQELTYQKLQYLPDLKAQGGYGLNALSSRTNSFSIQGTLNFPTINVMDIKYKIDEAKARLDVADNAVNQLTKDIHFSVQKAYVNMVQNEKKIPLTEVAVRQTFENLELAMGRYEVGLGNFLEVQDAIVNYNQAQENYVKLIFDYNVSRAKLELEIAKLDDKYKNYYPQIASASFENISETDQKISNNKNKNKKNKKSKKIKGTK